MNPKTRYVLAALALGYGLFMFFGLINSIGGVL
jgi:hypothetical protein